MGLNAPHVNSLGWLAWLLDQARQANLQLDIIAKISP